MSPDEQDTAEMTLPPEVTSSDFFSSTPSAVKIAVGARTHIGLRRAENQDHHAVIRRARSQQVVLSDVMLDQTHEVEEIAYLMMVADGMGGQVFGEFASRVVIQTLWELTARATSWVMRMKHIDSPRMRDRVQAYVAELQKTLRIQSEMDPRLEGMGTTLTTAYLVGRDAIVSHIGDSRAYLSRDGRLMRITEDQTLAQRLLDMGGSPEEVARYRNVLSNCLSTQDETVEAAIFHVPLQENDKLMLCSDGLTRELSDEELRVELAVERTPQQLCDHLLQMALDRGGHDNITIVVAQLETA
jgi:serine/threonine protein phosphatase PrpC